MCCFFQFSVFLCICVTGELRYWHPSQNNGQVLDHPVLVRTAQDFITFMDALRHSDILEWARQQRPNTKWIVDIVTNVTLYINKIKGHPVGALVDLPSYIAKNMSLISLHKDQHHHKVYDDNLCLFRCLALHTGFSQHSFSMVVRQLFREYCPQEDIGSFAGVYLHELSYIEKKFKVNINVWELEKDEATGDIACVLNRRSEGRFKEDMNINLYLNHFSYIIDVEKYAKSFKCSTCGKLWKEAGQLHRHEKTCELGVNYKYVGGYYHPHLTVFDELEDAGVDVAEEFRYYPYRATFDFECYFSKDDLPADTAKVTWKATHIPLSVSLCSNIPGYTEPICLVTTGNSEELIKNMIMKLEEMSAAANELLTDRYQDILSALNWKLAEALQIEPGDGKHLHPLATLKKKLQDHLQQLPVFGFNSSRYDINLIKPYLITAIQSQIEFVVKKNNAMMCLSTEDLKFLDVMNYLAPGYSYEKYVKAYDCTMQKGHFPYEWLDSLEKLQYDRLPAKEDFYSSLKKQDIAESDYEEMQSVWKTKGMKTVRDLLIWYNNLDVLPFLEALEKQFQFYSTRGIDPFKEALSVPGLTTTYMYKTLDCDASFSLFKEKDEDQYFKMKDNIVGGPSIVFSRYQEKDVTKIRGVEYGESAKTCKACVGYDANALYLWALMQAMPTGPYIVRRQENIFKPEMADKHGHSAVEYLDYMTHTTGNYIQHQMNAKEKRVGRRNIAVDGFDKTTQTIYQYHGCYYHGHECVDKVYNELKKRPMAELREETKAMTTYIELLGYTVVEMWECEWQKLKKTDQSVKDFIRQRTNLRAKKEFTEAELVEAIKKDKLFGTVECDIQVPEHLHAYFKEMPPIFKNTEISREDIGDLMKNYAIKHKIMSQPRRSLISSYFGEKILLTTPLLKWYLEHGLVITKIYQVVQWEPLACFRSFGNTVSAARRTGDKHPDQAILAETMKLLGNSGYGKTVTNKEKHRDVRYVCADEAGGLVNDKRFIQLNELNEDTCEVELMKKVVKLDLPMQIGFFVYAYAKLRMLEFYFDFLDCYLDRRDFEYCEMDTDSAYIALSAPDMEQLVKKELREDFYKKRETWLPAEACNYHKDEYIRKRTNGEAWSSTQECCLTRAKYDKRTPGLFKVEWEGDGIVSLCSKTYYCFGDKPKCTTKGLNKRQNSLDKEAFLEVLNTQKTGGGFNTGFRFHENKMRTYTQRRDALSYFYPKRKVLEDGVSTTPLLI